MDYRENHLLAAIERERELSFSFPAGRERMGVCSFLPSFLLASVGFCLIRKLPFFFFFFFFYFFFCLFCLLPSCLPISYTSFRFCQNSEIYPPQFQPNLSLFAFQNLFSIGIIGTISTHRFPFTKLYTKKM